MALDTTRLLKLAEETAQKAGELLKTHTTTIVENSGRDIKISADRVGHECVVKELEKSGIPVLSEEGDSWNFNADLQWVVDPLDGSLNFARNIPFSAISIALCKDSKPLLGVVHDLNRDELFSGIVGKGAWLNGKDITVSDIKKKNDAVIMTGFPTFTDYSSDALKEYISFVQHFKKVRLFGSAGGRVFTRY